VIGGQKIVANFTAGLRRIYEYCFPLEDRRARQAYGVASGVNNVLIINHVTTPGRVTAILVHKTRLLIAATTSTDRTYFKLRAPKAAPLP